MNDYGSWTQDSTWYEKLKVGDDMNDSRSWEEGSRCYENLMGVDYMNDLGCELKNLDAMNNSKLWMTWTSLGLEIKVLHTMDTGQGVR